MTQIGDGNSEVIGPNELVPFGAFSSGLLPAVIADAGEQAGKGFATFFTDNIRNPNTREAYYRNAMHFFAWCEQHGLTLPRIESFHVSAYVEELCRVMADSSVKQKLASLRMLFDWLVVRQVIPTNPAMAVRGPKVVIRKGKTPVMDEDQARQFFASFDTSHVVGLRDRALCAVMTYALPRVSAACGMNVEDYYPNGKVWWLRFSEKGGRFHEMPAHHTLVEYLDAYLAATGIAGDAKGPLFRTARGRKRELTTNRMHRANALAMVKRRAREAGIAMNICNHTFRGTGITNYMENGGELQKAQDMAGHADPRTTRLYDRSGNQASLDEVERIHI